MEDVIVKKFLLLLICLLTLALYACAKQQPASPEAEPDTEESALLGADEPSLDSALPEMEEEETEPKEFEETEEAPPDDNYTLQVGDTAISVTRVHPGEEGYKTYWKFSFHRSEEAFVEYTLPNGNKIIQEEDDLSIYLLTDAGEKVLLVQGDKGIDDYDAAGNIVYGTNIHDARVFQMIDDRRFIYFIHGWETTCCCGLYDLAMMQDYRLSSCCGDHDSVEFQDDPLVAAGQNPLTVYDNSLFSIGNALYVGYNGEFNLSKTDLTTFQTEKLLPDIPIELLLNMWDCAISPDGKYFAILGSEISWNFSPINIAFSIHIFSLEDESLLCVLPLTGINHIDFDSPTQLRAFEYDSTNSTDHPNKVVFIDINSDNDMEVISS
jgi:hypothetical protein